MINWIGFFPAAFVISLVPGANQLLGLRNAARYGFGYALAGIAGRLVAFVVLVGLVAAGLGAVIASSATVMTVLKWAGAAYLLWLGISSLLRLRRDGARPAAVEQPRKGWRSLAVGEFGVALSNPKALLLFAALLPQFSTVTGPGTQLALAELGSAYLLVELVVGFGYLAVGRGLGTAGIRAKAQRRIDAGSGVCFLVLAGVLAADNAL
ncbi:LysE family translocator [Amycolatopsis benzoatilytica]|uniref:LysE family translocator n=1 Tax=Amycolatopsis benzoatilytica TaxID=346045 RepID=UPI00036AA3E4|nr:LysE family translocator [Amycolatopsis benzoatilytica]